MRLHLAQDSAVSRTPHARPNLHVRLVQGSAASMTAQAAWTPLWAAPEVFRQERATVKADIWSFGIILWELVSKQNVAEFPAYGMTVQMAVRAAALAVVRLYM